MDSGTDVIWEPLGSGVMPGSSLARLHRADAALSLYEVAEATAKAKALQATANPVERALLELRLAREVGDDDRALRAAQSLPRLAPASPEAHSIVSRMHTLRGEDKLARAAASSAGKLDPESLSTHALLGESYTFREPRDLDKAAHHFAKTVELRPKIAATYVSLGDVYRAGLRLEAASVEYGKAMAADPTYPVSSIKRGHVNSFLGNYPPARADYDTGIALDNTRIGLSHRNSAGERALHVPKGCRFGHQMTVLCSYMVRRIERCAILLALNSSLVGFCSVCGR